MKDAARHSGAKTRDDDHAATTRTTLYAFNLALAIAACSLGCAVLGWDVEHLFFSMFYVAGTSYVISFVLMQLLKQQSIQPHRPISYRTWLLAIASFLFFGVFGFERLFELLRPLLQGQSPSPSQFRDGAHGLVSAVLGVMCAGHLLGERRDNQASEVPSAGSNASLNRGE